MALTEVSNNIQSIGNTLALVYSLSLELKSFNIIVNRPYQPDIYGLAIFEKKSPCIMMYHWFLSVRLRLYVCCSSFFFFVSLIFFFFNFCAFLCSPEKSVILFDRHLLHRVYCSYESLLFNNFGQLIEWIRTNEANLQELTYKKTTNKVKEGRSHTFALFCSLFFLVNRKQIHLTFQIDGGKKSKEERMR